jgi:hypothetical protein
LSDEFYRHVLTDGESQQKALERIMMLIDGLKEDLAAYRYDTEYRLGDVERKVNGLSLTVQRMWDEQHMKKGDG